jgi:hypothetical protein
MAGAAVDGSLTDDINLARQLEEMRAANQRLQRANSRLKEKQADLVEAVYRASKDAAVMTGRPGTIPRPARDRRRSPEVALLHLTDWQLGKKTDSYDTEVCKQRVGLAVAKTVKLTEIQRADHPVRDIHVMLGGDLVENVTIFPGQAYEVDSNAFTQVFEAAALVEQVVLSLLGAFESVTVHEVAGNHGRLGRKGDAGSTGSSRSESTARCLCMATRSSRSAGTSRRTAYSGRRTPGRPGVSRTRSVTCTSGTCISR